MKISIKKCKLNQLETLVNISRDTFISAFEKDNNPLDFQNYINVAFNKVTIKKELKNPNSFFYFLYVDSTLAGYCKLNFNDAQTEKFDKDAVEIERIYVLEKHQGNKLGEKMIVHALKISKKQHASALWLGVWEKNTNAIRFYERLGFTTFSSHEFYIGNDRQIDLLMRLNLN